MSAMEMFQQLRLKAKWGYKKKSFFLYGDRRKH